VLRTEIAVLQEQKSSLSNELSQARQDMTAQGDASHERITELQSVIRKLQAEVSHLDDVRKNCENTVRREAAEWSAREETYRVSVNELQGVIDKLKMERDEEAERTAVMEKSAILDLHAQVKELIEEKEEMLDRQRTFQERYRAKTLV